MLTSLTLAILILRVVLGSGGEIGGPVEPPAPHPAPDAVVPPPDPPGPAGPFARSNDAKRAQVASRALKPILTRQLTAAGLRFGDPVFIRVFKEEDALELWVQEAGKPTYQLFRTYPIAAWSGKIGPKLAEGDMQAPEGFYFVPPAMLNPHSSFHLSFNLGYPNAYDRARGRTGSALMVHGSFVSAGCYAMTDAGIEEIYTLCDAALKNGQPYFRVHCFPFRMTAERMRKAGDDQWAAFWRNLKEGHDLFETKRIPPNVTVRDKTYLFE